MAVIDRRRARNGTLTYRVRVRRQGQPLRSATFLRLAEAREWGRQQEALARHPMPPVHALAEALQRYLREIAPRHTLHGQENVRTYAAYWQEALGTVRLDQLTPAQIVQAREGIAAPGAATRNHYVRFLGRVLTLAMREWGWCRENPVRLVQQLREPRGRVRFLSGAERLALMQACEHSATDWLYPLVVLALTTGARRGELLRLTWADIDWPRSRLTFHETKNTERRTVPLVALARKVLTAWHQQHAGEALVFPGLTRYRFQARWEQARHQARLEGFVFHDLRHTAASYLAMSGASLLEIAAILGHKSLKMVQRYAHLTEQHTAQVAERMAQQFLSQEG